MSTRPSVVFLYDLDLIHSNYRSLNGVEKRDSTHLHTAEPSFTSVLRLISLSILNHLTPKQANVQWAYRFYSSSYYKHTHKAGFQDLSEQSLEEFEESLNVCYEQHTSNGTPSSSGMSKAGILGRTLQDIATDFSWKTPTDSLTPTRKGRRNAKVPAEQNLHNLVFVFTEVPTDDSIGLFCNVNSNAPNLTPKAVMDCILTKDLLKKFNEFQLSLNFVDLSADSNKSFIIKIASDLRGAVINSAALISSFSFSQIFQAARATEQLQSSKDYCSNCQKLQLRPKFSMHIANMLVEVDVQCWDPTCSGSSPSFRYDDAHVPMLKCIPVFQGAVPNASLLCYDALYLLCAHENILEQQANERVLWVGRWNEHIFVVIPLNSSVASMIFPSSDWCLEFWKSRLDNTFDSKPSKRDQSSEITCFVDKVADIHLPQTVCGKSAEPSADEFVPQTQWGRLLQLRSNYSDRKMAHFGTHWERLKDCFQLDELHKEEVDLVRNSLDACPIERPKSSENFPSAVSSDAIKMKIGNSRIQNLRASQLLQKSQEVRARNSEIEREKLNKEKQAADEKREKKWKEVEAHIVVLRRSIISEDFIRTVSDDEKPVDKVQVLERLLELKKEAYESPVEEWQLFCLAQVIATTILYGWREPGAQNFEFGYDTIAKHFLKTPASIGRTVSKENKVHEFKFQVLLRLELCWMVPALAVEDEILQEVATLLQLLSISCPKSMSCFFQDTLVIHFENMLPDLLVNLGEEMNQTIPASLSELMSNLNARGTPSPALSSGLPSVQSAHSHQEAGGSQRPATRELRSRTLSRQPSINILQHKKQIALPNKSEKAPPVAASAPSQSKKDESTEVGRVRRSLQFGMDTPVKGGKSKSPNKLATPKRNSHQLGVSTLSFPEFTTPSKTTDLILAPETPSRLRSGGKSIRKTDGIHVVVESPEVKQEAVRSSPRRLQAAMALRRRASFYTSLNNADVSNAGSSRHWSRAESQVWSEKAKASAAISTEDGNAKPGHSAQFLFSRILSRNESGSNQTEPLVLSTPLKDIPELVELASCSAWNPPVLDLGKDKPNATNPLSTPLKNGNGTGPHLSAVSNATGNFLEVPASDFPVFAMPNGGTTPTKTPMKTPMKTPRHVQFDLSFQPATPSSKTKTIPGARSILKSPMPVAPSPHRNKTPLKVNDHFQPKTNSDRNTGLHVLDETSFDDARELDLLSPAKTTQQEKTSCTPPDRQDDVVRKLDEKTLLPEDEVQLQSPVKPVAKSTVSPLVLRRSSRSAVHGSNLMWSDPNWTVVDYKHLEDANEGIKSKSIGRRSRTQALKQSKPDEQTEDPYEFTNEEENETSNCQRSFGPDASTHKRKLFQSTSDKVPANKKRKVLQQSPPVSEKAAVMQSPSAASLRKFQPPLNSSLFHLENSPLLNSLDTKINV